MDSVKWLPQSASSTSTKTYTEPQRMSISRPASWTRRSIVSSYSKEMTQSERKKRPTRRRSTVSRQASHDLKADCSPSTHALDPPTIDETAQSLAVQSKDAVVWTVVAGLGSRGLEQKYAARGPMEVR